MNNAQATLNPVCEMDEYHSGRGSLFRLAQKRALGPAYISPKSLAFVHEIADTAMQITEQAWLLEGLKHRRGVVVKSYRPHAFQNRGRRTSIKELGRQVQLLQTLNHRHLVSVIGMGSYQHDSWEEVYNSLFLVEEYAGPMTVAKLIRGMAMHSFEMFLCYSYWDAMKWLEQLADVLAYLHSLGVFHGDVRCQNIYFTSPDVHQTDVRLGDLKPHRASYMQRSNLLASRDSSLKELQGKDTMPIPASTQHSLQAFKQQAVNHAGSAANGTSLESTDDQTGASYTYAPSSTVAAQAASSNTVQGGSAAGSFVQTASSNMAQAGSTASNFVLPARSNAVQGGSAGGSFVQTAGSNVAQAGSTSSSFVLPARSKHNLSKSGGQLPPSMPCSQSGDDDLGRSLPASHHSLYNNQTAPLGESKEAQSVPDTQDNDALTLHLLEQLAKESPDRGTRTRRLARASWSLGVGPTVRLNLPHALDAQFSYHQGLKKGLSFSHLPAQDPSPSQSSSNCLRTPTHPSPSPLLAQQPSALTPPPIATGSGRYHSAEIPSVGGQLYGSVPMPPSSGSASLPPLHQMGSGFLMATGGTNFARAAKQHQHQHQQHSRQSSLSGAEAPGALRTAMRTSSPGGRSPVSVTTLSPPYGGGSGGSDAPLPFDDGGRTWFSRFSWNSQEANMGSLTRLPNEPAPRIHHTHATPHHEAHGGFRRSSYTHHHDYADMWKGIDADASVRSKFSSEMKDQVNTIYDRSRQGKNATTQPQLAPQQQEQHPPTQSDGHEQPQGDVKPHSSVGKPPKKSVSFAAGLPRGKLPAWDVAIVYIAPEILTATMAQNEGQGKSLSSVSPSPEADTFAFAKVMYQLLWRSLLEPRAGSAEEELSAIQEYGHRVASGFREQVPSYWPEPVQALLQECWAQNPYERPTMAAVKERLAAMRKDEHIRRELAVADKHHRRCVRPGTPPGSVNLTDPAEVSCGCIVS